MPLLFLFIYLVLSHIIYLQKKDDIFTISQTVRITWFVAFILLFLFCIYYGLKFPTSNRFFYMLYTLFICYFLVFTFYVIRYRKSLKINLETIKNVSGNSNWVTIKYISKKYSIILLVLTFICFVYYWPYSHIPKWDGIILLLHLFLISSSIYMFFEEKLLSVKE